MRLIVTDGVFSMDGNVAPLKAIGQLADHYKAMIFIDECHATGFFGATGRCFLGAPLFFVVVPPLLPHDWWPFTFNCSRGTEEYFGLPNRADIINSTLGKALGGAAGGYTTGPKELIHLLRQRSRPYLFSNSLPPPVVAVAQKVYIKKQNILNRREKLAGLIVSASP